MTSPAQIRSRAEYARRVGLGRLDDKRTVAPAAATAAADWEDAGDIARRLGDVIRILPTLGVTPEVYRDLRAMPDVLADYADKCDEAAREIRSDTQARKEARR